MGERYRKIKPFGKAFAAEYKGFMKTHGVTNLQVAAVLGRNNGYVSERANGKRALDTDDIDALASLVPGWSGPALLIELSRRAEASKTPGSEMTTERFSNRDDTAVDSRLKIVPDARERFNRVLEKYGFEGQIAARGGEVDSLTDDALLEIAAAIEEIHSEDHHQ